MKSPFLIVHDFLSPMMCEKIINSAQVITPDTDGNGDPVKSERHISAFDTEIAERFRCLIPDIEQRYDCSYKALEKPTLQYFPENPKSPAQGPGCENAKFLRRQWVVHKDVDLVGFVWLKDFNDQVPLDVRHEVYGAKMEFPAFNFSLVPQRGTLVLFPAGPHFITVISHVFLGDMYQLKLNACISEKNNAKWFYQPQNFPGTWQDWLSEFM
jgi:hypothetical protein